jgi:putative ABC transport system permease protein
MSITSGFGRDLAQGWRRLAARPWWTAAVVATLALGVAAVGIVYSAAQGILLHPLPYRDPDQLALVYLEDVANEIERLDLSWNDFAALRDGASSLADAEVMASSNFRFNLTGEDHPVLVESAMVGWRFFEVLGAPVQVGRPFLPDDREWGDTPNVVISDHLWRRVFGTDNGVVGKTIRLDDRPAMVVGVAAPDLDLPAGADVWVATGPPSAAAPARMRDRRSFHIIARLAEGATIDRAAAELAAVSRTLQEQRPEQGEDVRLAAEPLLDTVYRDTGPALAVVGIAALLVLVIACANVAALLLVRTRQRRHELALRSVHGASPQRLARQVAVDPAWIGVLASIAGVALVALCMAAWPAIAPPAVPFADQVELDLRVVAFAIAVAMAAVAACAIVPLLRVLRLDLVSPLRETGDRAASGRGRGPRGLLVVLEVAFCLALLAGAALALDSYARFASIDPGFDPRQVLTSRISLVESRHPRDERAAFFASLAENVQALPGVESAAVVSQRPLADASGTDTDFTVEEQSVASQQDNPPANRQAASEEYFRTLGIPVLAGRTFDSRDRQQDRYSLIVSRGTAERFWPGREAVGRRIKLAAPAEDAPWYTVVGVVGDVRHRAWEDLRLDLYVPLTRWNFPSADLLVRTQGDPLEQIGPIRAAVAQLDPALALGDVATLEESIDDALAGRRFTSVLLASLAVVALLLTGVGIAGLISTWVDGMQRELGIRLAVGADRRDLVGMVAGRAGALVTAGLVVGAVIAALAYRGARSLLYGLEGVEAPALVIAVLLLMAAAALGAAPPLRRLIRADPVASLRQE